MRGKNTIIFNVNNFVRVRLTDTGRRYLRQQHVALFGNADRFKLPEEDESGWSRWQMHELMQQLGGNAIPPCTGPVPFETGILIEVDQGE